MKIALWCECSTQTKTMGVETYLWRLEVDSGTPPVVALPWWVALLHKAAQHDAWLPLTVCVSFLASPVSHLSQHCTITCSLSLSLNISFSLTATAYCPTSVSSFFASQRDTNMAITWSVLSIPRTMDLTVLFKATPSHTPRRCCMYAVHFADSIPFSAP